MSRRLPALLLALLLLTGCSSLPEEAEEPEEPPAPPPVEEPVTFRFGDRVMTPLEGMPLNPYDRSCFGTDSRGRMTYEAEGKRGRTGIDVSA